MQKVVGVRFDGSDKIYFFDGNNLELNKEDKVIVETERGMQLSTVEVPVHEDNSDKNHSKIIRKATSSDLDQFANNKSNALSALKQARKMSEDLNLNMQIIDADYSFDKRQLTFHFLADNRVDFRELVKNLAGVFKTRIELRQIGVRDKAKHVGGIGHCGRCLCCSKFLNELDNVSINMAKNQNLALNPNKINGVCGRLLCCLKYEDEQYKECRKCLPKPNSIVTIKEGSGKVINVDVLKGEYSVLLPNNEVIVVQKSTNGCC